MATAADMDAVVAGQARGGDRGDRGRGRGHGRGRGGCRGHRPGHGRGLWTSSWRPLRTWTQSLLAKPVVVTALAEAVAVIVVVVVAVAVAVVVAVDEAARLLSRLSLWTRPRSVDVTVATAADMDAVVAGQARQHWRRPWL